MRDLMLMLGYGYKELYKDAIKSSPVDQKNSVSGNRGIPELAEISELELGGIPEIFLNNSKTKIDPESDSGYLFFKTKNGNPWNLNSFNHTEKPKGRSNKR